MYKANSVKRVLAFAMTAVLTISSVYAADTVSEAASAKAVKSVVLKIGTKKVTKKTYTLKKGKTAKITVLVNPAKAKKSISFKTSKKTVATVSKSGKVTAKKVGTAKITVTVTGKNKKKKSTWVKIKVKQSQATPDETQQPTGEPTETSQPTLEPTAEPTPEPTPFQPIDITAETNPIGVTDAEGNPIYGGDPSVLVDGDTVYLYVGHDVSKAESYNIPEYCVYSTKDLKNWTYHGPVLNMKSVAWADKTAAWAGQVMKYNNKYYMYFCSWNNKDAGKQSIGVAVADSPTGPFVDKGEALVKGSVTTGESSTWNDIDPTAWIETDENGVEHRYLAWGNGKYFVCELNEDMVSVKDINGDGKITFGTQTSGKTSKNVDIIEKDMSNMSYTEAPWIYRRQDENGKYYGKYYLFYAYSWREQMAYTTTDDLLDGTWDGAHVVMEPSVTSNTNHMAVFDFKGKTYFVYHNGSMPGGSGFRRIPCITEIHFEEDGSIKAIPESAAGINGKISHIYSTSGTALAHEHFINSGADGDYPYTKVDVGTYVDPVEEDTQWVITAGKADKSNKDYVSIQSENKPGLYLTANDDKTVTMAQDYNLKAIADTAKRQTFVKKPGLSDSSLVSFESVSQPGMYITIVNGSLALTDGSNKAGATFSVDNKPSAPSDANTENGFSELKVNGKAIDTASEEYNLDVDFQTEEIEIEPVLTDKNGYYTVQMLDEDGNSESSTKLLAGYDELKSSISLEGKKTYIKLIVFAENHAVAKTFTITVTKDFSPFAIKDNIVATYAFEDSTDNATAMLKPATAGNPLDPAKNPVYNYADGRFGKGIVLNGSYGLKLADSKALNLGDSYTISFWMKPDSVGGSADPTLAAGTFKPEYWLSLTFDAKVWSKNGSYFDTPSANVYKAGEWQHVAVSVDGDKVGSKAKTVTANLYVNGKLVSSGDIASGIMTTENSAIYFGVNAWDAYFKGVLDDVMILNRTLSKSEIQVIASGEANVASGGEIQVVN